MMKTLKGLFAACAAILIISMFSPAPANAAAFNIHMQTVDQSNGFNFDYSLVTAGPANILSTVTSASGTITGLGTNSGYSGSITGFESAGGNSSWNWDNLFGGVSPYFSNSSTASGIVLDTSISGINAVNLYYAPGSGNTFLSLIKGNPLNAAAWNPGLQIDAATITVAETPIPASMWLFGSGLAFLGFVAFRSRNKAKALPNVAV